MRDGGGVVRDAVSTDNVASDQQSSVTIHMHDNQEEGASATVETERAPPVKPVPKDKRPTAAIPMRELIKRDAPAEFTAAVPAGVGGERGSAGIPMRELVERETAGTSLGTGKAAPKLVGIDRSLIVDEADEYMHPPAAPPKARPPSGGAEWRPTMLQLETISAVLPVAWRPAKALVESSPLEAYRWAHGAVATHAAQPLPRGDNESAVDHSLRVEAQSRHWSALVLPRAAGEEEYAYKERLHLFRPAVRRAAATRKPQAVLVLPQQRGEKPADRERRYAVQAVTCLPVLPRGPFERAVDFEGRCDTLRAAHHKWLNQLRADGGTILPPLVLPRAKGEAETVFAARLEVAVSPKACAVVLPQTEAEGEAHAHERLALQARVRDACVLPFDPAWETDDDYRFRLNAVDPATQRLQSPASARGHGRGGALLGGALSSMRRTLGSVRGSMKLASTRASTKLQRLGSSRRASLPGSTGVAHGAPPHQPPRVAEDTGVWRPSREPGGSHPRPGGARAALLEEQESTGKWRCCCC